jgi:hypothetical protein
MRIIIKLIKYLNIPILVNLLVMSDFKFIGAFTLNWHEK